MSEQFDADVLVVGTGPAGSTLGLALANYGIKVQLFTQFSWLANSPRAHITNQRAMEVLRDLGVEEQVKQIATPWEQMGESLITTSLVGEEIARLSAWGTGDERHGDYIKGSPCPLVDLIQPKMEALLAKNAAERGAIYNFNTEYLSHTQDEHGVTATFLNRITNTEFSLRAKYLVGMDGARSKIVEQLNLPLEGIMARAGTVYVTFKADLSQYVQHRPAILQWIVNPEASFGDLGMGLLRAITPWNEWIMGWGFDISKGEPQVTEEQVRARLNAFVGTEVEEVEIQKLSYWYVNQTWATEYSKGRVFCGGDAVHRHPPSSGLGSNTCMQDAFNLAWKLAYAVKGWAKESLLDSYTTERAPVGKQIVARANQSRFDYKHLKDVFGFDHGVTTQAEMLQRIFAEDDAGAEIRQKLFQALEIKHFEFNAQGVELNQRYDSNAVIAEVTAETFAQDSQLYLQATTRPGAKLPHTWLINAKGQKQSTLDIVGQGRFSLLTGLSGTGWKNAVHALNLPYLDVIQIGSREYRDVYGTWNQKSEIHEAGAVLVRPDGYVAWRMQDKPEADFDYLKTLQEVLSKIQLAV
ncbi:FAD-dependent monooxygenase [Acinetobacter sp.]|uniref:FAD-dependent monooxygenase n=1 Tax=Acinetobacter sp. TaxID=472 RepID=UPI002647D491|nr:FAD-dependent monooxygenase [Acinetobacter sp.]MDN5512741.1 FAD-dependent monooxygenase [Acinetobacter sp.]MDN5525333.1 FAD-dependent monooxygenase [Acinetobacter sp.]